MSVDWDQHAKAYWDEQPHPRGHGLKIKEILPAVKLASMLKFGGHASLHEAKMFWDDFAPGGVPIISPQDFEHALERIAPVSFAFHGKPPTLKELVALHDKPPSDAHRYYGELPDKQHPEVMAKDLVQHFQAARPHAREHLEREPTKGEAAYLHHSGESPSAYFQRLAAQNKPEQQNGLQTQVGGNAGEGSVGNAGRQPPRK